jgi:hypothetical protein
MGYLDDLKKQAQTIREEQRSSSPQEEQQAAIERALQLSLRLIYAYLRELATQLNVVKPNLSVSYDIVGYGRIADLSQGDYSVEVDDFKIIGELSLAFACRHRDPRPRVITTADGCAFLRQRDFLGRHDLKFDSKLAISGGGTFLLEPWVPVSIRFLSDTKTRRIRCVIKNLEHLGEESYLIDPLRLKRPHLDGIAGLVLRKPNSLEKLTGPLITDSARVRIRRALAEERRQQLRHEAEVAAISCAEERAEAERRFLARVRRGSTLASDRLVAAARGLWKHFASYVIAVCQAGYEELKNMSSKISKQIHSYLSR